MMQPHMMAQMVMNPPAMEETQVRSLVREDPLEMPPPARGPGTLIPSAQRYVWAAKQPLGNAALGQSLGQKDPLEKSPMSHVN